MTISWDHIRRAEYVAEAIVRHIYKVLGADMGAAIVLEADATAAIRDGLMFWDENADLDRFVRRLEQDGATVHQCFTCGYIAKVDHATASAISSCAIENPKIGEYLCRCQNS